MNTFIKEKTINNEEFISVDYNTWSYLESLYGGLEIKRRVLHSKYDYEIESDL
jgi:hypothetical protein